MKKKWEYIPFPMYINDNIINTERQFRLCLNLLEEEKILPKPIRFIFKLFYKYKYHKFIDNMETVKKEVQMCRNKI